MMGASTSSEGERTRCPGRQFTGKATRLQKLPGGFFAFRKDWYASSTPEIENFVTAITKCLIWVPPVNGFTVAANAPFANARTSGRH